MKRMSPQEEINRINRRLEKLYALNDKRHEDEIAALEEELDSIAWEIDARIF